MADTIGNTAAHIVGAAKLIVSDLEAARAYYQDLFGMKVVNHLNYSPEVYEEYIMAFETGPRLALFAPNPQQEAPLRKSDYPQVLIYAADFDGQVGKVEAAGRKVHVLPSQTDDVRVAVTRDPAGNIVEIYYEPAGPRIAASKLIVDDRAAAEDFYRDVFGGDIYKRLDSPLYDEVLLKYPRGAILALFQPLKEDPLPKSQYPSTAIYSTDFDNVLAKLDRRGHGYRWVDTRTEGLRIVIARDPAGNAIEVIAQQPQ